MKGPLFVVAVAAIVIITIVRVVVAGRATSAHECFFPPPGQQWVPRGNVLLLSGGRYNLSLLGHAGVAYLFGETSVIGWWYYFPVALLFKTQLGLIVLTIFALFVGRSLEPALIAMAILTVAMMASINIGIRHLLPIYVPMAVAAAIWSATVRDDKQATPAHGWIAISETPIAFAGGDVSCLRGQGYQRIGKSIRLYFVP